MSPSPIGRQAVHRDRPPLRFQETQDVALSVRSRLDCNVAESAAGVLPTTVMLPAAAGIHRAFSAKLRRRAEAP